MKLYRVSALIFVLGVSMCASVHAADAGWYLAADLGRSNFDNGPLDDLVTTGWNGSVTDRDTGHRLTGGYQFNPYWGLELSHVDLGRASVDSTSPLPVHLPDVPTFFDDTVTAKGWEVAGTGTYPLSDSWALIGRLGAIRGQTEFHQVSNGFVINPNADVMKTNWQTSFGFGATWQFYPNWSVRAGWDRYPRLGDDSIGHYGVNQLTLGISYQFQPD